MKFLFAVLVIVSLATLIVIESSYSDISHDAKLIKQSILCGTWIISLVIVATRK